MSIPAHIAAIKSLRLSIAGQIKLAKYSQTAIEYADSQIQRRSNIQRPFSYFEKLARDQQALEGQPIDYKLSNDLAADYGSAAEGKELLEDMVIKWDVPKRPLGAQDKAAAKRSQKREGLAAQHTDGSNSQNAWWHETLRLRDVDHDEYIRRIRSKQKKWHKPHERTNDEQDTSTAVRQPTDLDIAWHAWCDGEGAYALAAEQANPDLNGSAFKAFLATSQYGQYLLERKPILRQFLQSLLRKDYPPESQAADETGPARTAPERTATPLSQFKDIALWHENKILAQTVTPYLDETSPWEEVL